MDDPDRKRKLREELKKWLDDKKSEPDSMGGRQLTVVLTAFAIFTYIVFKMSKISVTDDIQKFKQILNEGGRVTVI